MSAENDQKQPDLKERGAPAAADTTQQTADPGAAKPPAGNAAAVSIDDGQILADLERLFIRYIAVEPRLPLVLALWTVATYCFYLFDAFPYLAISSPTKRCGKTRLLDLLRMVCQRTKATVGISTAALFRTVDEEHPTLMIDEAESLSSKTEKAESLREILNAGYRNGYKVTRCQGPNQERRQFDVYCPKALALIGELPDTLADRCIPIRMRRRGVNEKVDRLRFANLVREAIPLCERLKNWVSAHVGEIGRWYNENDLLFVEDREAELWLPLFAVCSRLSPQRMAELEVIAGELSDGKTIGEPDALPIRLLADLRDAFTRRGVDRIATGALVTDDLFSSEEGPWRD